MLSVVMPSVLMLNFVMLSVVMLNVVAANIRLGMKKFSDVDTSSNNSE
jgi:hypothetical protein